jgi:hypothetical protein
MLRFAAYAWEKAGTKQVVYRAADGNIHELFVPVGVLGGIQTLT